MSGKAFGERFAIIPDSIIEAPISANAFRLFAILQRHSDVFGHCYPGRARLAEILRCSHDTVSRAKKELVDAGFISCQERYDELGRRTTDDVFLHPPRRNPAEYVRRTGADSNSKEVELEPHELEVRAGASADAAPPPGTTPPLWAEQELWQDEKGNWFVGPAKADPK